MKSYELKPTYDNLLMTYKNDSIGRNSDIKAFAKILDNLSDSYSIALDGEWGSGKTFFVKQTKLYIDAHNNHIQSSISKDKETFTNVQDSEIFKPQVTVYYDAWENDNDSDPVLSLIYSIICNVNSDYKLNETSVLDKAATILEFFTGRNYQATIQKLKGENPLEEIGKEKNLENDIKSFLDSLLAEKGERLIIFIDELDRCKPSYAVKLLERIKHYFDNDRITFVFAINAKELQHTIKRYYGNDFDAYRYLDRFFDLRIALPPIDKSKYFYSINFTSDYAYDETCRAVIEYYDFSLREIAKFINMVKIAAYEPTHNSKKYNFIFPDEKGRLFCLIYLIPIMIGLKLYNIEEYDSFIKGKNSTPFIHILSTLKHPNFDFLLSNAEEYNATGSDKKTVKLEDKLKLAYEAIFSLLDLENSYSIDIGQYTFNKNTKDVLLRTISLLSNYATIDKGEN